MLCSFSSGEILSARRKVDNGRSPKGDVIGKLAFRNEARSAEKEKRQLPSFFTVSRLLVAGDTPTVSAVCSFRLADRILRDTQQDSMTLCSVTFIVLNQQDRFAR